MNTIAAQSYFGGTKPQIAGLSTKGQQREDLEMAGSSDECKFFIFLLL